MAEIHYKHREALHKIDTYDNVISTYEWMRDALRSVFQDQDGLQLCCIVKFSSNEMSYECNSIDEFKRYALGKNIEVKHMLVYVSENWMESLVNISAVYHNGDMQEFLLSAKDEMIIINVRDALRTNRKPTEKSHEPIVMKIEDNSVHIGDNNHISNSIVGSKNKTESEQKPDDPERKKDTFWSKTFWQFIVPVAVGVIVIAIAVWLGLQ